MPPRRLNDTQAERLLQALESLEYRQQLAARIAAKEGIQYKSAMRRLQRYIATASERRVFAHAPVAKVRIMRQEARALPAPFLPRPLPPPPPPKHRRPVQEPLIPSFFKPVPPSPLKPPPRRAKPQYPVTQYDYPAIKAYFDGNEDEAIEALDLQRRRAGREIINEPDLFRLAAELIDISNVEGADTINDKIRVFYRELASEDFEDIQDFTALLFNLPDWQISMILADLENGDTTFADWLDAWRDDDMSLDTEDSEYWALWREAYARIGKKG